MSSAAPWRHSAALVITMLPFAVVAPILGPALDYRRSGRRVLVLVSMLGRAVLAFMMAVIALSLPELVILRRVLKPRLIATFVAVVTAGIILVGYLFNALF